jgi:ankyrin repeat protein
MLRQENTGPERGQKALQLAAERNDVRTMMKLLEQNADINLRSRKEEMSAFLAACQFGSPDAVEFLLDKGASVPKDGISFANLRISARSTDYKHYNKTNIARILLILRQ